MAPRATSPLRPGRRVAVGFARAAMRLPVAVHVNAATSGVRDGAADGADGAVGSADVGPPGLDDGEGERVVHAAIESSVPRTNVERRPRGFVERRLMRSPTLRAPGASLPLTSGGHLVVFSKPIP